APERSVRPRSRPAPRAVPAPAPETPDPEPEEPQIDPVTAALNAALMAGEEAPAGPEAAAAPLAEQFIRGMQLAIAECWNLGALSSAALSTIVVVEMELTRDGKPVANSIKMLGFEGGDEISAERAFETALRAIQGCGAQGFELPKDQFATWRRVELTFNPEKMRVR
ncbi:energy transducer TonB, partial [Planktomarina temperata]|nr:energy transducer TonB [Planktomarina temperata]